MLEMAGLSEDQRQRVAAERRRAQGRQVLDRLTYPFVAALVAALSQPQEGDRAMPETEETPAPEQPASEQTE
ncbi:hypothetical protein KBZ21_40665, partial [Streptomyces sp. A73]|nr:hypothetical protein [Streptomyces sp. A73]